MQIYLQFSERECFCDLLYLLGTRFDTPMAPAGQTRDGGLSAFYESKVTI